MMSASESVENVAVRLVGVFKSFLTDEVETRAVRNANLDISMGEAVAIVGRSGSGKSTLLSLIGLLSQPDRGEVFLMGTSTSKLTIGEIDNLRGGSIGFVFQDFHLVPYLTVEENVLLALETSLLTHRQKVERVKVVLEAVELTSRARHLPRQLSGGQQQRVAIARAVVKNPPIILADEPTGNLDSETGDTVFATLRQIQQPSSTLVIVTHSEALAARVGRVVTMRDGQLCPA